MSRILMWIICLTLVLGLLGLLAVAQSGLAAGKVTALHGALAPLREKLKWQ